MKTAGAVVVAFVLMLVGWGAMMGLMVGILAVAGKTGYASELPVFLTIGISWFIAPGLAGYIGAGTVPSVIKSADPARFSAAFMSSLVTLLAVFSGIEILLSFAGRVRASEFIGFAGQVASLLVGAWLGRPRPPEVEAVTVTGSDADR